MDEEWDDAIAVDEVDVPWPVVTTVDGTEVRIVGELVDGRVVRVHGVAPDCPHMGQPLTRAVVDDGRIECPRHWYAFDPDTGACVSPARDDCRLEVHPARIVDGRVQLRRPS